MHETTTLPYDLLTPAVQQMLLAAATAEVSSGSNAEATFKQRVKDLMAGDADLRPEYADAMAREKYSEEFMQYQLVSYCQKLVPMLSKLDPNLPKITFPNVLLTDEIKAAINAELVKHEQRAAAGEETLHPHHQQARERLTKIGVSVT